MKTVHVGKVQIGPLSPLAVMSGPCVIESEAHALETAEALVAIFEQIPGVQLIYKSSYDKANRSSGNSFRGPGLQKGLEILHRIKETFQIPVLTDVHTPEEAEAAGEVCDVIQIPAFLCRQTDLILAAGRTGAVVNVKKGQFMAPGDMKNVVKKLLSTGNDQIILTDRGVSFGYNNLVSDMRAIPIMQRLGFPVCFDASHSVQIPGGCGTSSGGEVEFVEILAKAAIAAGCQCIFVESHPNPAEAKSDKDSVYPMADLPRFIRHLNSLYQLIQEQTQRAQLAGLVKEE